jgi:hypothetical protein
MRDAAAQLRELADKFPVPEHGRYVREPARLDESGVAYLPPKPPDRLMRATAGISAALLAIGCASVLLHKPDKR